MFGHIVTFGHMWSRCHILSTDHILQVLSFCCGVRVVKLSILSYCHCHSIMSFGNHITNRHCRFRMMTGWYWAHRDQNLYRSNCSIEARGWLGNSIACEVGLGVGFLVSDRVSQAFVLFAFGEGRVLVAKVEVLGVGDQSFWTLRAFFCLFFPKIVFCHSFLFFQKFVFLVIIFWFCVAQFAFRMVGCWPVLLVFCQRGVEVCIQK